MSISLISRGLMDIFYGLERESDIRMHFHDYEIVYNTVKAILLDMIPIGFQLTSMIFGYIRIRNEKKRQRLRDHLQKYMAQHGKAKTDRLIE